MNYIMLNLMWIIYLASIIVASFVILLVSNDIDNIKVIYTSIGMISGSFGIGILVGRHQTIKYVDLIKSELHKIKNIE